MIRTITIIIAALSLSACITPVKLGISEAQWQNYSLEERECIKQGYHEILREKYHSEEAVSDGSILEVKIFGGRVNMPPFLVSSTYSPIEFQILNGECQTVTVRDEMRDQEVAMKVCYQGKTLYIDPSRYEPIKRKGSIQLHCSPIWERGFTYTNLSSSGYVRLSDVNIIVKKFK